MRYLLDTNILSEPAKPKPSPLVLARLSRFGNECATTSAVWHELWFGCFRLPESKRRQELQQYLRQIADSTMPILPYDEDCATLHARLRSQMAASGAPCSPVDLHIASVALQYDLTLVTRNLRDFGQIPKLDLENWFEFT
ncbi:type II toxin-antitoxin system VapC family toxin [bacterium]|nr:type II toxin-antitoxin system VapC family toxin [bacterium]